MFKRYADDQVVRGIMRYFSNEKENEKMQALDIGCGCGRHAKVCLEMGMHVKAVDIEEQNIVDTKMLLNEYLNKKLQVECADFLNMNETNAYDLIVAWNFLYAYNDKPEDCTDRLKKIVTMLKGGGKVTMSLKSDEDSWKTSGVKRGGGSGVIDNPLYDAPGYVFYSQDEMVDAISECGLAIDYFEKFSRTYAMDWKNLSSNEEWKSKKLDVNEVWYAICATKK